MDENEAIKLHIAGATVQHMPPFDHLPSFRNDIELSQAFIDQWVMPFYMRIGSTTEEWVNQLIAIKPNITNDIIEKNLGDFNWRTRQTGAFFAAITNQPQYIDIIGTHLLKSEVCYAGAIYCQVLASFNTKSCVDYLNTYLDYYLTKPDLWFDQAEAMQAILHLDRLNDTHHFDRHSKNWASFVANKPTWNKTMNTIDLEEQLIVIQTVSNH